MRKKLFGAKDECRFVHKFSCVARGKLTSRLSDALDRPFASNLLPAIHFNAHASAVLMDFLPATTPPPAIRMTSRIFLTLNLCRITFCAQSYIECNKTRFTHKWSGS
uniref:Uncharacterized protein n=1 Tax=Pseudomonas mandelii TaxID=75612 RepID=A0A890JB88_9PSED|nr:hypothetical protein [Pseudomonas mandelii]